MHILKQEHDAVGGLFFIITNFTLALIMLICLDLSWSSQCIAIADNLANIACINYTIDSYTEGTNDFNGIVYLNDNIPNNPLVDFNNMLSSSGIASSLSDRCYITWNKSEKTARIQFGSFRTTLNTSITPHETSNVIE